MNRKKVKFEDQPSHMHQSNSKQNNTSQLASKGNNDATFSLKNANCVSFEPYVRKR